MWVGQSVCSKTLQLTHIMVSFLPHPKISYMAGTNTLIVLQYFPNVGWMECLFPNTLKNYIWLAQTMGFMPDVAQMECQFTNTLAYLPIQGSTLQVYYCLNLKYYTLPAQIMDLMLGVGWMEGSFTNTLAYSMTIKINVLNHWLQKLRNIQSKLLRC